MYFQLRRQIAASAILGNSQLESLKRLRRVVGYMTIYPIVYIILSLPLAIGRMATAGKDVASIIFFCCSGAIITSSGLVDVVLYTLTRRNLITDSEPSQDHSNNKFNSSKSKRGGGTHLTTITSRLIPRANSAALSPMTLTVTAQRMGLFHPAHLANTAMITK
ncbi:Glucose receptor Git3, C-terminal [Penicillium italicum]|uniref:Glucose receptor Git3, C-terminal n=1 Tax=Penicillium italicum TaxID=40296 RepID=A0A0A2LDL3_PENIT|nr:Glucose receptor Git3, C-terminal [Penicillium italicum]